MSRNLVFILILFVLLSFLPRIEFDSVEVRAFNGYPVYNFDTGLNYTTIQEAINANETLDGHSLVLDYDHVFYEHVVVNKSVRLYGSMYIGYPERITTINGNGTGTAITVEADNVTMLLIKIVNGNNGIYHEEADNCILSYLKITNNIETGICINNSKNCTLQDCNITDNRYNFGVEGSSLEHFIHTVISSTINGEPIYYLITKRDRHILQDAGFIAAINCTNITIKNQNLTHNRQGLLLAYSNNSVIRNVNINSNLYGIYVQHSSNNTIYHNNFINNAIPIYSYDSINTWDDGYPSGGNYWSDYTGNDVYLGPYQNETGNDEIGDMPYTIDSDNIDHYPSMHPWNYLPIHNVNTRLHYSTIQETINAPETADGHTILVDARTYYEHVVVNKSLIIIGESIENTIINDLSFGRVFDVTTRNIRIEGFTVKGYYCFLLRDATNTTIKKNRILYDTYGVLLSNSTDNKIIDNVLEGEGFISILLSDKSSKNVIENNSFSGSMFNIGIKLNLDTSRNLIIGNSITGNELGIYLCDSHNNTIIGNTLSGNHYGIRMESSHNNVVYHNNFVENTYQLDGAISLNYWDNCFEGNYWSYYNGEDANLDGIGDTPYTVDSDNYPLMGMFHKFNTSLGYNVDVISNSTIDNFEYFESNNTIRMHVSNMTPSQTLGFFRISISHVLMFEPYNITVNGVKPHYVNYTLYDNSTHRWIYFTYEHSTLEIVIVPELSSVIALPLFMIATLLAALIYKRKYDSLTK